MKRTLLLMVLASMGVGMQGCGSAKIEPTKDLVVVEQIDSVYGGHEENNYCCASFNVDVPVNGPQALVDSVMALVNREVYKMCEYCIEFNDRPGKYVTYSEKKMFSNDGKRLLSHYLDQYKPLIEDSLRNTFGLKLKMEAQTRKYVTYGVERFYYGASCSSEKHFYTFDKSDGHQVRKIINHENLVRFFSDYPEYTSKDDDPWFGRAGWQFNPEDDTRKYDYGLLYDHFSLAIQGCGNHFLPLSLPYGQIFSYLSPEVQALVERNEENEPMLPSYLPDYSEDGKAWMEVDTVNQTLLGYISTTDGSHVSTLIHYEPEFEVYPKRVHSIDAEDGSMVYLFIYSSGRLLYYDEAMACIIDEKYLYPAKLFTTREGNRDSVANCMWYDQIVEATDGFPFQEFDENRFGLHYDWFTKRLYVPMMDRIEKGPEYGSCPCYLGRYEVLQFNGKEFEPTGDDGAWWLNKDLRNYKRTISNKKTADGIEQIDMMPDNTYRRTFWKGAKTLDDLRKEPDKVKISKQRDFKE